mmetsp:Transcript_9468/g.16105  ORF Transcript_9468/g.16105 Transcript_9468/m.16105 type:complete len:323 (+) Transcript_9468:119-1087(+)
MANFNLQSQIAAPPDHRKKRGKCALAKPTSAPNSTLGVEGTKHPRRVFAERDCVHVVVRVRKVHLQALLQVRRELQVVFAVRRGEHQASDGRPARRDGLLFDPPHGEHLSSERHFPRHGHVRTSRFVHGQAQQGSGHGHPRRGPVFWGGPFRHVQMNPRVRQERVVLVSDAAVVEEVPCERVGDLARLRHHLPELARRHERPSPLVTATLLLTTTTTIIKPATTVHCVAIARRCPLSFGAPPRPVGRPGHLRHFNVQRGAPHARPRQPHHHTRRAAPFVQAVRSEQRLPHKFVQRILAHHPPALLRRSLRRRRARGRGQPRR